MYVLKLIDCTLCRKYLECLTKQAGPFTETICPNLGRMKLYKPPFMNEAVTMAALERVTDWPVFLERILFTIKSRPRSNGGISPLLKAIANYIYMHQSELSEEAKLCFKEIEEFFYKE